MKCKGLRCTGCSDSQCYSKGGNVTLKDSLIAQDDNTNSDPIYTSTGSAAGQPQSGYGHDWNKNADNSYSMDDYSDPKTWRKSRVAAAYSKGGTVHANSREDNEKGVHLPSWNDSKGGQSRAGGTAMHVRQGSTFGEGTQKAKDHEKNEHKRVLSESKEIKPNLYAEGGEVEMGDDDMDNELSDMACGELLESIEKKDKAGILEALRAIVLGVR